jgi:hypothetical protein
VKILCDIRSQRAPVWLEGVYTGRMQFADPAITGDELAWALHAGTVSHVAWHDEVDRLAGQVHQP